jgi:hypothetical protein
MPPDYLLQCTVCGHEAVWDTDAVSPVGTPEVGHPVLWLCKACGRELRHTIVDLYVIVDKLHHEICLLTELDRATVDRVMDQVYRQRQKASEVGPLAVLDPAQEVEEAAEMARVPLETVAKISVAEVEWMLRRGYILDTPTNG